LFLFLVKFFISITQLFSLNYYKTLRYLLMRNAPKGKHITSPVSFFAILIKQNVCFCPDTNKNCDKLENNKMWMWKISASIRGVSKSKANQDDSSIQMWKNFVSSEKNHFAKCINRQNIIFFLSTKKEKKGNGNTSEIKFSFLMNLHPSAGTSINFKLMIYKDADNYSSLRRHFSRDSIIKCLTRREGELIREDGKSVWHGWKVIVGLCEHGWSVWSVVEQRSGFAISG
jgi:hypothetical protein